MSDKQNGRVSLGFGKLYTSPGDHIGHFYESKEEWRDLLVSFLKAGLKAGERCMYLMSPGPDMEELKGALAVAGVDVKGALASGQLRLNEGMSNPKDLQDSLHSALGDVPGRFPLLRWGGDMTWSLRKIATTEALMEWETHCNVIDSPPAVFLCQYDLTQFSGSVIMDAMKTHPTCVVSNAVHQNPYFQQPDLFLKDLRRRKTTALAP